MEEIIIIWMKYITLFVVLVPFLLQVLRDPSMPGATGSVLPHPSFQRLVMSLFTLTFDWTLGNLCLRDF